MRSFRWVVLVTLIPIGCGERAALLPDEGAAPTPCGQVIEGCSVRRLPNLVLRDGATDGVLSSVDGIDLSNVIGFDDALQAADDFSAQAKAVQVILGAADGAKHRWGAGRDLFYSVEWVGVPMPLAGPGESPPEFGTWATVLDARTGEFIVSGNG